MINALDMNGRNFASRNEALNPTYLIELDKVAKILSYCPNYYFDYYCLFDGGIIIVYDRATGERLWDVACHSITYGHQCGYLEAYGTIVSAEALKYDEVEGWLTADDIAKRLGF